MQSYMATLAGLECRGGYPCQFFTVSMPSLWGCNEDFRSVAEGSRFIDLPATEASISIMLPSRLETVQGEGTDKFDAVAVTAFQVEKRLQAGV